MADSSADQIARSSERWKLCAGLPETSLVRLAILRDLVQSLHAEKSHLLATGRKSQVQALKAVESRITELRGSAILEGELPDLLNPATALRKRTRLLPEALFSHLEREKIERYDRQWEASMAAEAAHLGWNFWQLETWVQISLVVEWNRQLMETVWPNALILFTESGTEATPTAGPQPLWHGRWLLIAHPRFRTGAELALNLDRFAGAPDGPPPSPPQWKLLFTPKKL